MTGAPTPTSEFLEWRAAVEAAAALRAQMIGRRVQKARRDWTPVDEVLATGVVSDVKATGIKVRWDISGQAEAHSPDYVAFL